MSTPDLAGETSTPATPVAEAPPPSTGSTDATSTTNASPSPASAPTSLSDALKAAVSSQGSTPPPAGPIPFDQHKTILENTRTKTREEVLAEWRAKHGWAEQVQPEQWQQVQERLRAMETDPIGFARSLVAQAARDPQHAATLRSWAGQMLGQQTPGVTPTQDPMPQPDFDQNGQLGYTPKQFAELQSWQQRQILKSVDEKLAPFQAERDARMKAEAAQQQEQAVASRATAMFKRVAALPHFEANRAAITAAFQAMPVQSEDDVANNIWAAYHQVVDPKVEGIITQKVYADLDTKARASTTVPRQGVISTPAAAPVAFGAVLKEKYEQAKGQ